MVGRTAKAGGPALLFGAVKGHDLPVLGNLLATEGRICRALGVASLDEVAQRIGRLLDTTGPGGWVERLKGGSQPAGLGSVDAAKSQVGRLPADRPAGKRYQPGGTAAAASCRGRNGRAISAATVFSAEPDSHRPTAGRFDIERLDRTRLAVCWSAYDEHARLLGEYRARSQKMPLAGVIGSDPAFLLAAAAPLPPGSDVCAVAGLLRENARCGRLPRRRFGRARRSGNRVGRILRSVAAASDGWSDVRADGVLYIPRSAVVMQVTAVTHRANPIFRVMAPGRPPHEACTVDRAMQQVFLPLAGAMPELIDYDLPEFAAARHWAAVSIRKSYASQGRRAAHAAWGLRPMMFAKVLVVVDGDVNVHDQQEVLAAVAANVRPGSDVLIEQGPPDPFDPAAPSGALGRRWQLMPREDRTRVTGQHRLASMPIDKSSDRVQQMFGQIAGRYDFLNWLLSLGIDRSWRRKTVELVPPAGDAPILDVCTGTADLALAYWRASKGKIPIVGADFCQPMLDIARQKCRRAAPKAKSP